MRILFFVEWLGLIIRIDNVAESFYGTPSWDDYWSKLNGDGNMTWGREYFWLTLAVVILTLNRIVADALLTDLGKQQATLAHNAWITERSKRDPVPLVR